jgi:hypothetical protein
MSPESQNEPSVEVTHVGEKVEHADIHQSMEPILESLHDICSRPPFSYAQVRLAQIATQTNPIDKMHSLWAFLIDVLKKVQTRSNQRAEAASKYADKFASFGEESLSVFTHEFAGLSGIQDSQTKLLACLEAAYKVLKYIRRSANPTGIKLQLNNSGHIEEKIIEGIAVVDTDLVSGSTLPAALQAAWGDRTARFHLLRNYFAHTILPTMEEFGHPVAFGGDGMMALTENQNGLKFPDAAGLMIAAIVQDTTDFAHVLFEQGVASPQGLPYYTRVGALGGSDAIATVGDMMAPHGAESPAVRVFIHMLTARRAARKCLTLRKPHMEAGFFGINTVSSKLDGGDRMQKLGKLTDEHGKPRILRENGWITAELWELMDPALQKYWTRVLQDIEVPDVSPKIDIYAIENGTHIDVDAVRKEVEHRK